MTVDDADYIKQLCDGPWPNQRCEDCYHAEDCENMKYPYYKQHPELCRHFHTEDDLEFM